MKLNEVCYAAVDADGAAGADVATVVCGICGQESPLNEVHALTLYAERPESMEPPDEEFWCDGCYGEEAAQVDRASKAFWRGPSRP